MSAHTPGPWEKRSTDCQNDWSSGTCPKCGACHYITVRREPYERLHAAASALLEALEQACDSVAPDRFGDGRPAWYDEARATIRAAKGETK